MKLFKYLFFIFVAQVAIAGLSEVHAQCDYNAFNNTGKDQGIGIVYERPGEPWVVTAGADDVTISNSRTQPGCKMEQGNVTAVYFGAKNKVILESTSASTDELVYVQAKNCKVTKVISLPVDERKRTKKLKQLKICT